MDIFHYWLNKEYTACGMLIDTILVTKRWSKVTCFRCLHSSAAKKANK